VNATRVLLILAIIVVTGAATWLLWPRPDLLIEVARGGTATVVNPYGWRSPLSDTVFVGGSGARRRVRVVNRDTTTHTLALFTAKPGTQLDYTVPPGTFGGFCSAHPTSKSLTVVVR
jgi:hypothetical protein